MATAIRRIPLDELPSIDAQSLEIMTDAEVRDELEYVTAKLRAARALRDQDAEARLLESERALEDELRSRYLAPIAAAPADPLSFTMLGLAMIGMPAPRR